MASKGIRFKVWQGTSTVGPGDYYFHILLGNNKTTNPSEGYGKLDDCFDTIEALWFDTAVAHGSELAIDFRDAYKRAEAIRQYSAHVAVPYTKDSLRRRGAPAPRPVVKRVPLSDGVVKLGVATPAKRVRPDVKRVPRPEVKRVNLAKTNYGKQR